MAEELELETPELVDDEVVDPGVEDQTDPEDAAKSEEPFLPVNDRTIYKTREDAIKGYNEAANRIAALSGWEKQAKQWGLSDPQQFTAVAQELLQLRKEKADAAKAAGVKNDTSKGPANPKEKEAQQVREYMKGLGYISKDDQEEALRELRDQIAEMRQSGSQSRELYFQNQEEEARGSLDTMLTEKGIQDDASKTKATIIGTLIKDWINNSDERVDQWSKGGVAAKALVKQGFDHATSLLGWGQAAPKVLKPTDPGYAAAKAKALAANKKGLPAPGTAKDPKTGKFTPKQKGHINAALHEKAWEMFQNGEE
jgi:hypothetical protein